MLVPGVLVIPHRGLRPEGEGAEGVEDAHGIPEEGRIEEAGRGDEGESAVHQALGVFDREGLDAPCDGEGRYPFHEPGRDQRARGEGARRDERGLLGGEEEPEGESRGYEPPSLAGRGGGRREDHAQREGHEERLVDEVSREKDGAGRGGVEGGGGKRHGRARPREQAPQHHQGQQPEEYGGAAHRRIGESQDGHERKREVVERRPVIVARVVLVGALADQAGQEEAVDALVVVERAQAQVLAKQEQGEGEDEKGDRVGLRDSLHRTFSRR